VYGLLANNEVWGLKEKARRFLQASAAEAYGRPGVYVLLIALMKQAEIADEEEARAIAQYLQWQGWIEEADADYGVFLLTPEGIHVAEHLLEPSGVPVTSSENDGDEHQAYLAGDTDLQKAPWWRRLLGL
jgi:hypothetical protein